jgi:uracil-DNA glycosylase family 4
MPNYVPGEGNPNAKLFIIGEAPGAAEDAQCKPFVGPSGKLLDSVLQEAGISRSECYVTNVIKYRPPNNELRRLKEIGITNIEEQCMPALLEEIKGISPNVLLILGNTPLKYLCGQTGINKWRGSILHTRYPNYCAKAIPSIHPAALLHGEQGFTKWSMKVPMTLDYKRAVQESLTPHINLPSRLLQICRNANQLYQFLGRYKDKSFLSIDIEVIKCIPICIGLAFTSNHAISVPLLNIEGAQNLQMPMTELVQIWQILGKLLASPNIKVIGQNFKFDHEKLLRPCGFRISNVYFDTMIAAHCLHAELEKKLAFLTSIYTREPYYKDDGKEFNPKKDNIDNFLTYNARDAAVTFEVYEEMTQSLAHHKLQDFFTFQMKLHKEYMDIEHLGFNVDHEKRRELIAKYSDWESLVWLELQRLVGYEMPTTFINSPKQISNLLYNELSIPFRSDTSEDTLCALLANTVKDKRQRDIIENIYTLRRVKKAKKSIEARLDYDGRCRTGYRLFNETGRTATGVLKAPVRPDQIGQSFQAMTKHGEFGADIRYMFTADPGYILINSDLGQAEPRVVALLSEDYETLKAFDTIDIHRLTASWLYKKPYEEIGTGDDPERFTGKTCRNAGNYDMGKRTMMLDFISKARRFHINATMSEKEAELNLRIFHAKNPKIRGIFHAEIRKAIRDNHRVLINPYGRYRIFLDQMGASLEREAFAHIPQSTVGDKLKNCIINIMARVREERLSFRIIVEAHDAICGQCLESELEKTKQIIKEEFEKPIDFSRCTLSRGQLIIPCQIETGYNYKELKKVKNVL